MNSNTLPQVGTHGAFSIGSDSHPCTVVAVSKSGHRITVERDRVVRYTPFPDCYGEEFERVEGGVKTIFTRRKNGSYVIAGSKYGTLSLNGWRAYSDPHI